MQLAFFVWNFVVGKLFSMREIIDNLFSLIQTCIAGGQMEYDGR